MLLKECYTAGNIAAWVKQAADKFGIHIAFLAKGRPPTYLLAGGGMSASGAITVSRAYAFTITFAIGAYASNSRF